MAIRCSVKRGAALTVGRALSSDVPLLDPTVSRRHASLVADESGIELNDLGSSNGTFVNGERVEHARIGAGDVLTFGKLSFNVSESDASENGTDGHGVRHAPTIVRQRAVPDARRRSRKLRASGSQIVVDETAIVLPAQQRVRQRLALLLEAEGTHARPTWRRCWKIAEMVFQILDVDRFAILLLDDHHDLIPSIARSEARPPPDGAAHDRTQGNQERSRSCRTTPETSGSAASPSSISSASANCRRSGPRTGWPECCTSAT
jgi:hypothetical protein